MMTEDLKNGYLHHIGEELDRSGASKTIRLFEEYNGEKSFVLAPTQLDGATQSQQAKNVKKWCDLFEREQLGLDRLWITSRVNQRILDAVCHQESLTLLFIKWGVYESVENLSRLPNLEHLRLGGGKSLKSIDSVFGLSRLKSFESHWLFGIHDYSGLAALDSLVDLSINGVEPVQIDSLEFLERMPQLERLHLLQTRIGDHSYLPILKLPNLKYLTLPNDRDLKKDMDSFQRFYSHLL